MPPDIRAPFGEFLYSCFDEYRRACADGKVPRSLWIEKADEWHKKWHDARVKPKKPKVKKEPSTDAERIYEMYPRKVARPVALRAIAKALAKLPFDILSSRVQVFCSCVERWPPRDKPHAIPHPTTFFNQERYEDSPETYIRADMKPLPPPPKAELPAIPEPDGWREKILRTYSTRSMLYACAEELKGWDKLGHVVHASIIQAVKAIDLEDNK